MLLAPVAIHNGFDKVTKAGRLVGIGQNQVGLIKERSRWFAFKQPSGAALNGEHGDKSKREAIRVAKITLRQIERFRKLSA